MRNAYLLLIALMFTVNVYAQKQLVVAQDGSGKYKTVQQAINAVPDSQTTETIIYIKKGIYKEKLMLPPGKQHITLKGENNKSTIITYDDFASKKDSIGKNIGTSGSASFHIFGSYFTAINLTFENSSGLVGQAVAVWSGGNRSYFKNCRFLGFQDTLYTAGTNTVQLYEDCYIEGTVDFIFGAATAWFDNCTIFCKNKGGYITAAATPEKVKFGYVFYRCKIVGEAAVNTYYLGRPWRPNAKTVFIECDLGNQIKGEGWNIWSNKDNLSTTYYAEYKNKGEGFQPEKRAAWSHQLTDEERQGYQKLLVLQGWKP